MSPKKVALYTAIVLGVLLLALLLWEFHHAFITFMFSLAVAAAARPQVERWSRKGMPRVLALVLVYLLSIGLVVLIFVLVGNTFAAELQQMTDNLARSYDYIWQAWPKGTQVQQMIIHQMPAPADLYANFSPDKQDAAVQTILGITLSSFTLISDAAAILILSIYWSIDQVHFERLWLSLLPVESRARYRDMWRDIERDFGSYVRSELLQSLFAGVLLGVGLYFMGVPYPVLLAVFAALVWLIPWLGGLLALLPVALVGLTSGLGLGILASVYTLAVLFFLEFFIEPRFIRRRQYSSILNILLILILVQPFGLLGLIAAPPLAAAIELIYRYSLQARVTPVQDESVQRIVELRERVKHVRRMLKNASEEPEPQTASLLDRLDGLVDQADRTIAEYERSTRSQRARVREPGR